MIVKNFVAPALPVPTPDYSQPQQTDTSRALRLYFNLLDRYLNDISTILNGGTDGLGLTMPFIGASDSGDQVSAANDTPTLVTWDTLDGGYLWALGSPGKATAQVPGYYKIDYSLQFANTDNAAHDAVVWLKVNGNDVPRSTTVFTLPARKSAGVPSYVCGYSTVTFEVTDGDYIELYWATDQAFISGTQDGIYIYSEAAQTSPYVRPAIPSAIGNITFLSSTPPA